MHYREGFLFQVIIYSIVWLIDDYIGLLLCLILGIVIGGLLLFALIADLVERSKVPKSYYWWMLISSLTPLLVALIFTLIYKGNFEWLKG